MAETRRNLVSVVIPVHDGEAYVAEAIDSVLAQTYRPLAVIVVDDGSTDGSLEVARRFGPPVRVYHQAHAGAASARNYGVRQAHGEFLAFLDADDLWTPDKLRLQTGAFRRHPTLDLVLGHAESFHDESSDGRAPRATNEIVPGYSACAMLIRQTVFARVGGFDTRWRVGEFIDWFARAEDAGLSVLMLPEVVFRRRVHGRNLGIEGRKHQADYVKIVKAALERRRLSAP